ncbi:DUF6134 family protein [Acidisoma sp. C75]
MRHGRAVASPSCCGRRSLLGLGGGAAALWVLRGQPGFAQVIPADRRLAFDLMRNGSKIGEETVTFHQAGDDLTVTVEASIRVRMAFVTLYHLEHHETESWSGGRLLSFAATTLKNGRNFFAQGWRVHEDFMVRGTAVPAPYVAPPGALPTSQWNHAMLRGPMINTQDGRLMRPVVTDLGIAEVSTAAGTTIPARHYNARGDLHFDTFFTQSWEWVGLSFRAKDGSLVTYELT